VFLNALLDFIDQLIFLMASGWLGWG